ncbi:MAG: prepilin-type N-terminal cleavage/methylation domain-containing protein [candidate division WOR-3 bacterium]
MRRKGFTLIELLVVIAIIAILAAIALPQFAKYRLRAFNSAAESDLKNIRTVFEAYYSDYFTYPQQIPVSTGNITVQYPGKPQETISLSNGVYMQANVSAATGANDSYTVVTHHVGGDEEYGGDSDAAAVYFKKDRAYIGEQIPVACPGANANQIDFVGWNIK